MDQITEPPAPPVYDGDGDAYSQLMAAWFFGWLGPTFVPEMNTLVDEMNNLVPSIDAAMAGANYKGVYSAGTTYQVGQSVSYSGEFYLANTVNNGVTPTDGANWSKIGGVLNAIVGVQLITATGTYTRSVGATKALVFCVQGGQAGGNVSNSGTSGTVRVGVVSPDATESVTIGAGGAAPNGTGGHSSFGSLMSSSSGGSFGYANASAAGFAAGATPFGFGQGGFVRTSGGAGTAGVGYGAGGGGGATGGGAGAPGCILVVEFK